MTEKQALPTKPTGVIASLAAGFDTVIQGWWIPLFPIALDLFLWLGPRLSILPVVDRALDSLTDLVEENPAIDLIRETAAQINYFSSVSVAPLGIPNLMTVKLPVSTPLGEPVVWTVEGELSLLALFVVLSLGGLLLGGIYLGLIAQQVRDRRPDPRRLLGILPRYWLSVVALLIALVLLVAIIGTPVMLIATLLSGLGVWIASVTVWIGIMLLMWLIFHLIFSIHGMLLSEQPLLPSILASLRLVSMNSFSTMGLVAIALAISAGLNYVWSLPQEDSWMLMIGIIGHGIITSGLLAATFVYYQDRHRYWRELQAYMSAAAKTSNDLEPR